MDISITGRKMNVGQALTTHANDRLQAIAEKYFSRTIGGSATFSGERHVCRCDISLHPNQGINLHARAEAVDPYAAFDSAADKAEKQLRRYKRRLKNHHNGSPAEEVAPYAVLSPSEDDLGADDANVANENVSEEADHQPIIVAESHKRIPRVSVGDAVMLMDLEDAGAFMFRNAKNERLEVIYRRSDGNIGWISPDITPAQAAAE